MGFLPRFGQNRTCSQLHPGGSPFQRIRLPAVTSYLLDWRSENLRVRDAGIFSYKDASRTFRAGRNGEAILNLWAVENGYVYWDHLPTLVERALNKARISHEEQVRFAHGP